jgi:hypothetical protein
MTGSRKSIGCTISARAAAAPPSGSPRRFAAGLGLLVALAALIATFGAANASAFECYSGNPNLGECNTQYLVGSVGGSLVMPTTTTYFVYWDPKGAPAFPAGYESGITAFFKGLEHDNGTDQNFYSVLTQYGVKYDTHFGKAITDKDAYPAETSECAERPSTPCVSDVQIKAELRGLVKGQKLPGQVFEPGQATSQEATHSYFVLLPPGVSICDATRTEPGGGTHIGIGCSSIQFCSFHDFAFNSEYEPAEDVVYGVMPYLPGIKGCETPQHPSGIFDDELTAMEHEFAEMTTDPYAVGWENTYAAGAQEVADICETDAWSMPSEAFHGEMMWGTPLGTAPNGALYNQVIDGRDYYLLQMYSDETEGCVQRRALPPAASKLSEKKGPAAGGTQVTISGLNFKGPDVTSVKFGAFEASKFTIESGSSLTAEAPPATAGKVSVTVTTSAATSAPGPSFTFGNPTVTSVSPATGPKAGGEAVAVTGSGFALGGATTFMFGKELATSVSCTSTTSCTLVTPPDAKAATVDVRATADEKKSKKNSPADQYTYH